MTPRVEPPMEPPALRAPRAPPPFPGQPPARRRILSVGLVGAAGVLAGCRQESTASGGGAAGSVGPADLTFTSWWTDVNQPWGPAMEREVLPAFAKAYPTIKESHVTLPAHSPGLEKLQALIAAGTPPDVTFISPWSIPPLANAGALVVLDPLIRRDDAEFQSKDWVEEALATGRWAGKLYGVPTDINVTNIYHNRPLFDAVGVQYPTDAWTYAAYLDAAGRLTRGEGAGRV